MHPLKYPENNCIAYAQIAIIRGSFNSFSQRFLPNPLARKWFVIMYPFVASASRSSPGGLLPLSHSLLCLILSLSCICLHASACFSSSCSCRTAAPDTSASLLRSLPGTCFFVSTQHSGPHLPMRLTVRRTSNEVGLLFRKMGP